MEEIQIKCSYTKLVPIEQIKEHPKNNNKHPKEQIDRMVDILKYTGFRRPLVVSNQSGLLIAGHGRLYTARLLGMKYVPVDFQDYENEDQEYADMVADNALQEWSKIDLSQINNDLENFDPSFDLEMLGLKNFTIDVSEDFLDEKNLKDEKQNIVLVNCKDESDMQLIYEDMTRRGYECKLIP